MMPAGPGRDSLFTKERQAGIIKDLAAGNNRTSAAERNGICLRTFLRWMKKGRLGKQPEYVSFVSRVKKAERDAEQKAVASIIKAGEKIWTAHAWWLERKFPDQWGKRDRVELTGNRKKPVEVVEVVVNSREEADQVLARNDSTANVPKSK